MIRNPVALNMQSFDLLVVGGGIYGLTIAYDAARRGLQVALIERGDFGGGASFNHARTIHGGLRYLQSFDVARSRESIRERRTMARIAPHAVQPLPFVLPLSRALTRGKLALRVALTLDRLLAFDRNRGVIAERHLPPGRVLSRARVVDDFPGLLRRGLTGAAVWHDYVTLEADRLTFAWALAAVEHGAVLANYVEAQSLTADGSRITGVRARDLVGGHDLKIDARVTVNATAAGSDRLLGTAGLRSDLQFMKATNLVTSRAAGREAIGARSANGRYVFLIPYRGRALFGTWESPGLVTPEAGGASSPPIASVSPGELDGLIAQTNDAFPSLDLTRADVTLVHRGIVPAAVAPDGSLALEGHVQIKEHSESLVTVVGTKYTTARAVAARIVDLALARLGRPHVPSTSADSPLPGGDIPGIAGFVAAARRDFDGRLPHDTIPHLVACYGSRFRAVADLSVRSPAWSERLTDASPVVGGELAWAARHEMVVTLADAVMRRTPLGAMEYPGDLAAATAAEIVGEELGWGADRRTQEIDQLRRAYEIT